jgi:hypothetical protein
MKRLLLFPVLLSVLLAGPALAVVPSTMSYQGVLMDNAGALVPDGNYSLTFKLYNVASGGSAIWTETQGTVAVSRGGFGVTLGSVTPLAGVGFDVPYWLGITVGAGTELAPRVQLASSPYGLSLRLPFAGGISSASPALAIGNPGGGPAITADPLLTVGTTSSDGTVRVYANGVVGAEIADYGTGGYLHLMDNSGYATLRLEPDMNGGNTGFFAVGSHVYVDGNNGSGSATVHIAGSGGVTDFNTDLTGNAAVMLPASSISASEMLDEPGIAQGLASGSVTVPIGSTMGDIVTVSITTPVAGYIVVEASALHVLQGSATVTYNYAYAQIDETAGGPADYPHLTGSGFTGGTPGINADYRYTPLSTRRTYYKPAGTYTFRLEAYGSQSETLQNYLYSPTITATFYPTSYGTVTTAVTPEEASRFSDVQHPATAGQPQLGGALQSAGSSESVLVDLRELELRDAEARAQAERAHRQLIEARLAEQQAKVAKPATTQQP